MIFGGFEDEKWQPMEGGCLGIEILTGEWPENTRKAGGGGLAVQREGRERRQRKPCVVYQVENTWCRKDLVDIYTKYLAKISP